MDITVKILDKEYEILESWLGTGQAEIWLQHAINNKIRKRVDASILELTDRNPKKMTHEVKLETLDKVELPIRKEK